MEFCHQNNQVKPVKPQFVHFGQGQTESEAYSVPLVCPYWSVHWHQTKKTGQLDTPKINEVMFLLHGCKNHTLEFLLSVSSTNNVPLVKVCAKSWTETIWVAYLLLLESVYRIKREITILTHKFVFCFLSVTSLLTKPIRDKWENPIPRLETFHENQQKTRYFPLQSLNVLPLSHSFQTSVYHDFFFVSRNMRIIVYMLW